VALFGKTVSQQVANALDLFEGVRARLQTALDSGRIETERINEEVLRLQGERAATHAAMCKAESALNGITALLEGRKAGE